MRCCSPKMTRLRALAITGCMCQILVTVGVPVMQFFLVFGVSKAYMHIVIVSGGSALIAGLLGMAAALSSGPALPALHAVASVTLAALMGGFNTQTFLDLSSRCNLAQAASAGCSRCACAPSSSCTTLQLATLPGCGSCRAIGADFCARSSSWQLLLLPYTGLIQAVLMALPAVFSLLALLQPTDDEAGRSSSDCEAGRAGRKHYSDGRVAVTAWGDERPSTQCEDWPLTTATPGVSGETGCKPMP